MKASVKKQLIYEPPWENWIVAVPASPEMAYIGLPEVRSISPDELPWMVRRAFPFLAQNEDQIRFSFGLMCPVGEPRAVLEFDVPDQDRTRAKHAVDIMIMLCHRCVSPERRPDTPWYVDAKVLMDCWMYASRESAQPASLHSRYANQFDPVWRLRMTDGKPEARKVHA